VGGGPAPGINGVIAAATIEARNLGWRVVGLYDGLRWLAQGITSQTIELEIPDVTRVHLDGGSILRVSRDGNVHVPAVRDRVLASLQKIGIDVLISIGGDGTASAASALADAADWLQVYHVPKTIDNDLPLPGGFSTFGYQTARHTGVEVLQHLMEDAKTTGRWYVVITMGRDAGHLALGIGKSAGATMTMIPEEFDGPISLDDIALRIEGAILRRLASQRRDGVAVLAEGLAKKLDPEELLRIDGLEHTQTGELKLSNLPLGNLVRKRLLTALDERGVDVQITTKVIGYELRCADPIPFDAEYTRDLGFGAIQAITENASNGIVCRIGSDVEVRPFSEFCDPETGRMRIRFVDTTSESYLVGSRYQLRLRQQDLDDPERRTQLALVAGLTPEELVRRFNGIAVPD
ncbi:MAG: 6-phosphofructokinase, partial [Planctomycetota bacterium]|nr:6-phosphofructokinase [Planctomycetota bacterium]